MTLPLSSTTVTVRKPVEDGTRDPYTTAPTYEVLATGVPAVIGSTGFSEEPVGGQQQVITRRLSANPVEGIDATCTVEDETTGIVYELVGVVSRQGMGLDHVAGELRLVVGESARG